MGTSSSRHVHVTAGDSAQLQQHLPQGLRARQLLEEICRTAQEYGELVLRSQGAKVVARSQDVQAVFQQWQALEHTIHLLKGPQLLWVATALQTLLEKLERSHARLLQLIDRTLLFKSVRTRADKVLRVLTDVEQAHCVFFYNCDVALKANAKVECNVHRDIEQEQVSSEMQTDGRPSASARGPANATAVVQQQRGLAGSVEKEAAKGEDSTSCWPLPAGANGVLWQSVQRAQQDMTIPTATIHPIQSVASAVATSSAASRSLSLKTSNIMDAQPRQRTAVSALQAAATAPVLHTTPPPAVEAASLTSGPLVDVSAFFLSSASSSGDLSRGSNPLVKRTTAQPPEPSIVAGTDDVRDLEGFCSASYDQRSGSGSPGTNKLLHWQAQRRRGNGTSGCSYWEPGALGRGVLDSGKQSAAHLQASPGQLDLDHPCLLFWLPMSPASANNPGNPSCNAVLLPQAQASPDMLGRIAAMANTVH